MRHFLILIIAIIATCVSSELTNCVEVGNNKVQWKIEGDHITFDTVFPEGSAGWVAFGIGPTEGTMAGMNQYMVYSRDGQVHFNEYFSSEEGQPNLYPTPHMTNVRAIVMGAGFRIQFTRKLFAQHRGYFHIRDQMIKMVVALNEEDVPKHRDDWNEHTRVTVKEINLFKRYNECNIKLV